MRVTAQAKLETEQSIRDAARNLFREKGLSATNTREIAAAAGVAAGTVFNYFPSKEALALRLVADALSDSRSLHRCPTGRLDTLESDLFGLIAVALRALEPMRPYLGEVLEAGLSPLAAGALSPEAERIRQEHLEDVVGVLGQQGLASSASPPTLHLYWALFLSVLSFWAADRSPTQEDTRALADQAVRMFAASLPRDIQVLPKEQA